MTYCQVSFIVQKGHKKLSQKCNKTLGMSKAVKPQNHSKLLFGLEKIIRKQLSPHGKTSWRCAFFFSPQRLLLPMPMWLNCKVVITLISKQMFGVVSRRSKQATQKRYPQKITAKKIEIRTHLGSN